MVWNNRLLPVRVRRPREKGLTIPPPEGEGVCLLCAADRAEGSTLCPRCLGELAWESGEVPQLQLEVAHG